MPPVTVAVPTYNGAAHLHEALSSVLAQTFTDFEVVVSDDGSTDGSVAIARSFDDPRIRVDTHERLGIGGNWNRCLDLATGTWTKMMGQDDLLHPDSLTTMVDLLESTPTAVIGFGPREVLHDEDDPRQAGWAAKYRRLERPLEPLAASNDGHELARRWIEHDWGSNLVGEPVATLFRTDVAREIGGFDVRLQQSLDTLMWLRLFVRGDVCYTPEELVVFRHHEASATHQNRTVLRPLTERHRQLRAMAEDEVLSGLLPELRGWRFANFYLRGLARAAAHRFGARDVNS